MKRSKMFLPALVSLVMPCAGQESGGGMPWEERTFPASEGIMGLRITADVCRVQVSELTDGGDVRIGFQRKCESDKVKITVGEGVVNFDSARPQVGGCEVNYRAFLPKGAYLSVTAGDANVETSGMGEVEVKAGSLNLRSKRVCGNVNLQYASGDAELEYDSIPPFPVSSQINSAEGRATFLLPQEAKVKTSSARSELVKSDFVESLRANFSFIFNSCDGLLQIRKRASRL